MNLIWIYLLLQITHQTIAKVCTSDLVCGFNSQCVSNECRCRDDYSNNVNGANCTHDLCGLKDCVQCLDAVKCKRCIHVLSVSTSECLPSCNGDIHFEINDEREGLICTQATVISENNTISNLLIAVIIVLIISVVVFFVITIYLCCRYKRLQSRGDENTMGTEGELRKHVTGDFQPTIEVIENKQAIEDSQHLNISTQSPAAHRETFDDIHHEMQVYISNLEDLLDDVMQKRRRFEADLAALDGIGYASLQIQKLDKVASDLNAVCNLLERKITDIPTEEQDAMLLKWARQMIDPKLHWKKQRKSFTSFLPEEQPTFEIV